MIVLLWGAILALLIGIILLMVVMSRAGREWSDPAKREYNIKILQLAIAIIFIALVMMTAHIVSLYGSSQKSREYIEFHEVPQVSAREVHGSLPGPRLIPRRVISPDS